jgi:hypothetical protein
MHAGKGKGSPINTECITSTISIVTCQSLTKFILTCPNPLQAYKAVLRHQHLLHCNFRKGKHKMKMSDKWEAFFLRGKKDVWGS